jgi:hypothetical protein
MKFWLDCMGMMEILHRKKQLLIAKIIKYYIIKQTKLTYFPSSCDEIIIGAINSESTMWNGSFFAP